MLLERQRVPVLDAIEHLVGMQSQVPRDPYIGLWSRLDGFDPHELGRLMLERSAVRMTLMRTTLHLASARDALTLRSLVQGAIERWFTTGSQFGRDVAGIDRAELLAAGIDLLHEGPKSNSELGKLLSERFPHVESASLGYAIAILVPVVQVTPRGVWDQTMAAKLATLEDWIGATIPKSPPPEEVVMRYLRAFGPAAPADFTVWSGMRGVREVVDRLRPRLSSYRDESGRELLDIEDGVIASPDIPVPPRFLGQFDNAVLSHKDRTRILGERSFAVLGWRCPVLIDGFFAGAWRLRTERKKAVMTLEVDPMPKRRVRTEVENEAERLLEFLTPEARSRELEVEAASI